jgi:putative MFS transporter
MGPVTAESSFASSRKRLLFWAGTAAITVGVGLHLPMFIGASSTNYKLAGLPMEPSMYVGMALILAGLAGAAYGVVPERGMGRVASSVPIISLDKVTFGWSHLVLVSALIGALVIDVMKPASLGFVVPGARLEYGLSKATVALLPFVALTGTLLGSFFWGWLGDRIGRRAAVLLSAMFFAGTAICGTMPAFGWNLFMCFLMGTAAGGMLPVAFSLFSEFMPARHRGALVVFVGAVGAIGGFLAASTAAAVLEPHFGWRIMWLLNLPTGLILLVLNRLIPESPRFLLLHHRGEEAAAILKRFGASLVASDGDRSAWDRERAVKGGFGNLFKPRFRAVQSGVVTLYGAAYGLVNFGFLLWLPTNLRSAGLSAGASDALLAKSALLAFPGALIVMLLYGWWSTRWSLALLGLLTTVSLTGLAIVGPGNVNNDLLLGALVLGVIVCSSGMTSLLSPYCTEVFPTRLRSTGSGLAAGASKAGGVAGQAATLLQLAPSLALSAVITAAPVLLAALLIAGVGIETRGRRLEETYLPVT